MTVVHAYARGILGSLSKSVFERRTSTGSEVFSFIIWLDAAKFVLLSVFTLIETIWPNVKAHFRLTCVTQKLLCLSSLLSISVRAPNTLYWENLVHVVVHFLESKALYISRVKGVRMVVDLPLLCFVHQWKWHQSPDRRICTITWWWCFFHFPKDQLVPQSDQDTQWNTRLLESVFCEIRC